MEANERIIIALDMPDVKEAFRLADLLREYVGGFKFGFELIHSMLGSIISNGLELFAPPLPEWELDKFPDREGWFRSERCRRANEAVWEIGRLFAATHGKIFWDGKLCDIPNTVKRASGAITRFTGIKMFNVHALGSDAMMTAAFEAAKKEAEALGVNRPLVIAVTILTSLKSDDLIRIGFPFKVTKCTSDGEIDSAECDVEAIVCNLAKLAKDSGLDGVVCSPLEIKAIREACGPDFLIVTPGVRPAGAVLGDQKRVMTPGEAIKAGSNYLVIGRPITEAKDPVEATKKIVEEIAEAMEGREK